MGTIPNPTVRRLIPWLGLAAALAAVLGAFWCLLGYRYSPEKYELFLTIPGTMEFVWFGLGVAGSVFALVGLRGKEEATRDWLQATLRVAAYACVIVLKTIAGKPLRFYDMILFVVAFGLSVACCARKRGRWPVTDLVPEPTWVGWARASVWAVLGLLGLYYFFQQVYYLDNLALGYSDCGENARLMFNTMCNPHELFLRVNPDKAMFYDHFHPGILPLMPLWLIWPDLKLTIVLQIIAITGCAIPIYYLGTAALNDSTAGLLLALCWMAYPSASQMIYSGTYGFRWGNLCLLFYFIALALWFRGRPGWALVMLLWALLIKEDVAIMVGMFGIYLALFEMRRRLGWTMAIASFTYFLLVTCVIVPRANPSGYAETFQLFGHVGRTKWEILLSPVINPKVFWRRLFEARTLYFGAALLAPLLFLPLKKPSVLLIGSLTFLFLNLSPLLKSMTIHYQAALLPLAFWALTGALKQQDVLHRRALLTGVLAACIVESIFLGNAFWSKQTFPFRLWPGRLALLEKFKEDIDPNASLYATRRAAAHFITQKYLYVDVALTDSVDYVLLDLRDSWGGLIIDLDWLARMRVTQRRTESRPEMHLVRAEDGIILYARHGTPLDARSIVERDSVPPEVSQRPIDLGGGVRIVGSAVTLGPSGQDDGMKRVTVTTYTTVSSPTNVDLAVQGFLHVRDASVEGETYVSDIQPLGQGIWPIDRWTPGKFYTDEFSMLVPEETSLEHISFTFKSATPP